MWSCWVGHYKNEYRVWEREPVWKNVIGYTVLEIQKLDLFPSSGISQNGERAMFYHHIPNDASLSELTNL